MKDFVHHDDFLDAVKKAVRQAVRDELKDVKQELEKVAHQLDLYESRIVTLEMEKDSNSSLLIAMEEKLSDYVDWSNVILGGILIQRTTNSLHFNVRTFKLCSYFAF